MKAAVVISPGSLVVQEIPDPVIGPYDVLCETLACAVCCGTDNHIVAGHPYFHANYPLVLGHEGVGRVISCGGKVRYFRSEDVITRVINRLPEDSGYKMMYGAFAVLSIATDWRAMSEDGLSSDSWRPHTVHRSIPSHLDPVAATMIITWRETYSFLKRMYHRQNDSLLIVGSGATALAFADHARNLGIETAVVGNPGRENSFIRAGADRLVSYRHPDIEDALSHSRLLPFDLIIDTVGRSETLNRVLGLLKKSGKIGIYGLDSFHDYQIDFFRVPGDFSCYNGQSYDEGLAHNDVMASFLAGRLNPWDYLSKDHIYALDNINAALNACKDRKIFKSVISFD